MSDLIDLTRNILEARETDAEQRESRVYLQISIVDSYKDEYKELSDTLKSLEVKAQGVATIAGVFIGAVFAYIREIKADVPVLRQEKDILIISVFCLIVSTVFAVWALKIREMPATPFGKFFDDAASDIAKITNQQGFSQYIERFPKDQIRAWCELSAAANKINRDKAAYIWTAQVFLGIAILAVALYSFTKLLG